MAKYFDESEFRVALKAYRDCPSVDGLEGLAADFILPVSRGYCFSQCVCATETDREDFAQAAAIRCISKLHLLYRNGFQRAHPYLTRIVQSVVADEQERLNKSRTRAANQVRLASRLGLSTPAKQQCAGRRAIDNVASRSAAHAAAVIALIWLPCKGAPETRVARALGITKGRAAELVEEISDALRAEQASNN